ncbi:6417_t:CDS:10 [Acaulospora morrowiae]|uniref:6417_t:CDS:1 n=1 Tax=Acaulospora morrowiae TaxID=94023 RepID=A0A9N9C3N5_9GLOM|nr:6417_t:CDS:10 [Acaulospora morrowiae]
MSSDQSDAESASETFVDAEENLGEEVELKKSLRNSTATQSPSAGDSTGFLSTHLSDDVRQDLAPSSNTSNTVIPEISVTDMSENKDNEDVKPRGIVDVDLDSSVNGTNGTKLEKNTGNSEVDHDGIRAEVEDEPIDITVYVKDLDTGKKIPASDLEEEIRRSNGNIDPLSFTIMRRNNDFNDDMKSHSDEDERSNRNPKSLLKRLKKRSSRHEKKDMDEFDVTGNNAPVFSENFGGYGNAQPHYIKTRTRHKKDRDFDKLFLAQELNNPISNENGEANLGNNAIWIMKFSKDGKFLATGGQDTIVRVWAVISSDEEREHFLEGSGTSVYEGTSGAKLRAPVFRDKPLYEYCGHTADVLDLSWSKNNFLLSSSMDKTVRLWHITRKECLCCFQHADFVTAIAFHPKDDRFFLSGSLDCKLRLWNIPDKRVAHWNEVPDQNLITAVGFTLDGKMAVAGCFSGLCQFYETVGLKEFTGFSVRNTRGRNSSGKKITGIEAMPGTHPGLDKLLISSNDSRIRLYNMRDKSLEWKYKGIENTCSQIRATFSDDGRYIISGSEDRHIYIFKTDQSSTNSNNGAGGNSWLKKEKCSFESFEAHGATVTVAIFAPTRTKQLIGVCGDPIFANHDASVSPENRTYPDGNIIVSADCTGRIKIFRQDCAYYSSHDTDSRSIRSTRSFNSILGSNINNLFVKNKQPHNGGRPRRKSDASSMFSFTSSVLSADVSTNGNEDDAEEFQCECGSTEFKAFINKGKSKLVCANCHKIA